MTREEAIAQVRLAGLVCVGLHPDPPVGSLPYPSPAARARLDGRRRAGRFLLALADDASAGRVLAAEAWADAALLLGAVFMEPAQP